VPEIWDITEEPRMTEPDGTEKHVWTGIEIPVLGLEDKVVRSAHYPELVGEDGRTQVMDNDLPDDALFDGRTARRARELLGEFSKGEKPFFLAVGFRRPHLPWIAHQRYFDLFPADSMNPVVQPGTEEGLSPEIRRAMRAHYFAAVTSVDHHVGTLLDELERTGQADNTIVVLFGDHGYALGERDNRYGKGVMWDRALQTPLLVRVPGERTVSVVETPVGLLDVYPTLVELAGLPLPATPLDGRSLAGLIRGAATAFPDRVYSYYRGAPSKFADDYVGPERNAELIRSVRTSRFRYTERPGGRDPELIDVRADPFAWRNLASDPAYASIVAEMKGLLAIER
jgi:iduronate 2-sulfatase